MRRTAGLCAILLFAGCGGGGSAPQQVSASPSPAPTPSQTPAPTPAPAPPTAPAPITSQPVQVPPPLPPINVPPSPSAGPQPTPSAPSVSGEAVIASLVQVTSGVAAAGPADPEFFSSVATGYDQQSSRFTSRSWLTPFSADAPAHVQSNPVTLSLEASTDAGSTFVLAGSGSVTSSTGQYSVSGGQYAIPASVPLNRTLVQYGLPASPGSSIRLFVGTIDGFPGLMRVCWNFDIPGMLRVACTRHNLGNGRFVGVDAGHDVGGTILTHASYAGQALRRTVMSCVQTDESLDFATNQLVRKTRDYFWRYDYDITRPLGGIVLSDDGTSTVREPGNGQTVIEGPTPGGTATIILESAVFVSTTIPYASPFSRGTNTCRAL